MITSCKSHCPPLSYKYYVQIVHVKVISLSISFFPLLFLVLTKHFFYPYINEKLYIYIYNHRVGPKSPNSLNLTKLQPQQQEVGTRQATRYLDCWQWHPRLVSISQHFYLLHKKHASLELNQTCQICFTFMIHHTRCYIIIGFFFFFFEKKLVD